MYFNRNYLVPDLVEELDEVGLSKPIKFDQQGTKANVINQDVVPSSEPITVSSYASTEINLDRHPDSALASNVLLSSDRSFPTSSRGNSEKLRPNRFLSDLKINFNQINLPQTIEFGDDGRVKVTVTNQGSVPALGFVRLNLYGATDAKINRNPETNQLSNDVLLASERRFLTLGKGKSKTFTLKYDNITSFGAPGAYNLIAEIAPGRTIPEINRQNNVASRLVSAPGTDVVIDWNATALNAIQADGALGRGVPPSLGSRLLAITQAAVYDTVNAFKQTYTPYAVDIDAPAGASIGAAVAGAAHHALVGLLPGQKALFDTQLSKSLAEINRSDRAKTAGVAFGESVAAQILELRANDGYDNNTPYTPPSGNYVWRPGPDGVAVGPNWGGVTPFAIPSIEGFSPDGLDGTLGTDLYAEEIEQVRLLGAKQNTDLTTVTRTPDQTEIALFWAYDRADTFRPYGQLNQITQEVAVREGNTLAGNARLFAQLGIALADAAIVAWDVKYKVVQPRPDDVITGGIAANDGRNDTVSDPDWQPLLPTPPFPDYISGHSIFGGAFGAVMTDFFGDNYEFTAVSQELPGVTRTYGSFNQAAFDDAISRVYGGIHVLEASVTDSLPTGRNIGNFVVNNIAQPIV